MPKTFPPEFRPEVVAVAHQGEYLRAEIAGGLGIYESCSNRWRMLAHRDDGLRPPDADDVMTGSANSDAEFIELRKKSRPPDEENKAPRRATASFRTVRPRTLL